MGAKLLGGATFTLQIVVSVSTRNAIDRLAAESERSRSQMVRKLLNEALAARAAREGDTE